MRSRRETNTLEATLPDGEGLMALPISFLAIACIFVKGS